MYIYTSQTVAAFLAGLFEDELHTRLPATSTDSAIVAIQYSKARTVVLHHAGQRKVYNVEKRLEGDFAKFSNTVGDVLEHEPLALAFSHWTYVRSKGALMVVDVQGVRRSKNELRLTDPAIHSNFGGTRATGPGSCSMHMAQGSPAAGRGRGPLFGLNDLGVEGMRKFFRTHRCVEECRRLRLAPERTQPEFQGG